MPIYEYRCQSCGEVFEVEQRITEPPLKVHAHCGGEVTRLISHSTFILKGGGWYKTDYASSPRKGNGSEEGKGEKESSPGSSTPCGDHCACASS